MSLALNGFKGVILFDGLEDEVVLVVRYKENAHELEDDLEYTTKITNQIHDGINLSFMVHLSLRHNKLKVI